jgi:hypothetical protein
LASCSLFGSFILYPLSLVSAPQESYVIRTGGFIARFDRGCNVWLKFALGRDKAVTTATVVTMTRVSRMCSVYQDSKIRLQGVGSMSHRASLILYFVVADRNNRLGHNSLQLFLRALNPPDSSLLPTQPCASLLQANLRLEIEDRFFGHNKRRKSHWLY